MSKLSLVPRFLSKIRIRNSTRAKAGLIWDKMGFLFFTPGKYHRHLLSTPVDLQTPLFTAGFCILELTNGRGRWSLPANQHTPSPRIRREQLSMQTATLQIPGRQLSIVRLVDSSEE